MNVNSNKKRLIWGLVIVIFIGIIILSFIFFKKEKYNVSLMVDNEVVNSYEIKEGKQITAPKNPTKEGYTFLGWYIGNEKYDFSTPINSDLILEAKWEINNYKVTFNDGNNLDEITVDYHNKVEKPKNPTKKGYIFSGWYLNDELYDFDSLVEKDLNLEAKWEENKKTTLKVEHYLMNLDGTYSKNPDKVETINKNYNTTITPKVKTYEGFISPETKTITLKKGENNVVKYYYVRKKYQVVLENGNGINSTNGSGEYYYGAQVSIKANIKKGYTFDKWSNDNKDVNYTFVMPSKDITLKALAISNSNTPYKVRTYLMDTLGNYSVYEDETKEGITDSSAKIELKNLTGFTFDKMSDNKTINGDGSTVIEVFYKRNKYLLTINSTEGIQDINESKEYYYGTKVAINANLLEGYDFLGWFINNQKISSEFNYELTLEQDTTIVAQAQIQTFKINFIDNSESVKTLTKKYGETISQEEMPVLEKEYYDFMGWILNEEKYDINLPIKSDITLNSLWKVQDNTIVFYNNDEIYYAITGQTGDQIVLPDVPEIPTGYDFIGWYTKDGKLYNFEDNSTILEEGLELYAKYVFIIDIDEVIKSNITSQTYFTTEFLNDDNKVSVNIINPNYKIIDTDTKNNYLNTFANNYIKEINITYLGNEYKITKDEKTFDNFMKIFTNTSLLIYNERNVSSFYNKKITINVILDGNYAKSINNSLNEEYTINFTSDKVISKEKFANFSNHWLQEIEKNTVKNDYNKYHIQLNGNEIILITKDGNKSVLATVAGSGAKTTMQELLKLNYVKKMTLYFEGMDPVEIESDNITDENFEDFGLQILPYFAKAVNKSYWAAFGIKNYELVPLEVKCEITLKDEFALEDGIPLMYLIHFQVNPDIGNN